MNRIRDYEGYEVKSLLHSYPMAGKDVLEIGSGTGWLTWQYASNVRKVFGIDPYLEELHSAKADQPAGVNNAFIVQAMAESLPYPGASFDLALLANSL